MDFLVDIWESNSLAIILSLISILVIPILTHHYPSLIKFINNRLISIRRLCVDIKRRLCMYFRLRQAEKLVYNTLIPKYINGCPVHLYEQALVSADNSISLLDRLNIDFNLPSWFNDYYLCNALEILAANKKITKVPMIPWEDRFPLICTPWPLDPYIFYFMKPPTNQTIEELSDKIMVDNYCKSIQLTSLTDITCDQQIRYELIPGSQVTSINSIYYYEYIVLKSDSPPCLRCWEQSPGLLLESESILYLIRKLCKHDFKHDLINWSDVDLTVLQDMAHTACINADISDDDLKDIKKIIQRTIDVWANNDSEYMIQRQNQINSYAKSIKRK